MKVTFFGTYNVQQTPRVQTLMDGLRANSVEVNELNAPLMVSTADRVKIASQPWRLPLFGLKILACWLRLIGKRYTNRASKYVLVGYMGQFDVVLARLLYPTRIIILDYMISGAATVRDRKVGQSGGFKDKLLIWLDNSALRVSSIVVVDTEEHLEDMPEKYRHKGVIVPVGAPQYWFDAAHDPKTWKKPNQKNPLKVIFFGKYTPLQSTITIGKALAKVTKPLVVTMAGGGQDYEDTRKAADKAGKNVKIIWVDWANADVAAKHDVSLGIFGGNTKALKVVPNKSFQGEAVGTALITSDNKPQKRILKDSTIYVPVEDPIALAKALDDLADNPDKVLKMRKAAYDYSRAHFTPKQIVQPLLPLLI